MGNLCASRRSPVSVESIHSRHGTLPPSIASLVVILRHRRHCAWALSSQFAQFPRVKSTFQRTPRPSRGLSTSSMAIAPSLSHSFGTFLLALEVACSTHAPWLSISPDCEEMFPGGAGFCFVSSAPTLCINGFALIRFRVDWK